MNLNQLNYFVSAAQLHSFTRAAEEHYISQTAITQQIRALEQSVGVQLFNREKRPVELTPAGEVFLIEAKAILERMDSAVSKARDAATGLVGSLRIGYIKGYERSDLSARLRRFHKSNPNILLTCFRCDTDALTAGLLGGSYDMVFTWDSADILQDPRIDRREVGRAPLMAVLYRRHPLAQRPSLRREDLKNERIIYMSPSHTGESRRDALLEERYFKAGYRPDIIAHSGDAESVLMMVDAEEGVSILPDYITGKLTNAENLVFVPMEGEKEYEAIYCAWKKADTNPALRRFVRENFDAVP